MAGNHASGEPAPIQLAPRDQPEYSAAMRRIGIAGFAAVSVLTVSFIASGMRAQSAPMMAATAIALVVGLGGIGWHIMAQTPRWAPPVVTLTVSGLAGVVLVGLMPSGAGYFLTFTALIAIGMELPPVTAFAAGLIIFLSANALALGVAGLPVSNLAGNDVGGAFLFSVGVFTRSTRISQARARSAQARAEQLLAQLRAAQEAVAKNAALTERTRLAREVHDILAHSLSGLVLTLDTAELLGRRGDDDPETMARLLEQVSRAQRIARDGLAETRRAVAALRGGELPGPALLPRLVEQTSEATGLHAALTITGEQRPLSPEVGLALYRTAQEALINSAKYAGRGGAATLRLRYSTEDVALEITDVRSPDTRPPRPGALTFGGYGLTGIRERAELLGGQLTAGPAGQGFRVLLRLPTDVPVTTGGAVSTGKAANAEDTADPRDTVDAGTP
jgi:signal transduction histidine kinase